MSSMAKNRLNLDFSLPTNVERVEFIEKYLALPQWKINPLTPDELETIGNYLLYGKDADGKNAVQHKDVQIATRYGTWDRKEEESYEAILENPSFNENQIFPINAPAAPKVRRGTFSREEASLNPEMLALLEPLWEKIDALDLLLNCYDLRHGKRKKPIRPELLEKFTKEQIAEAHEKAAHLNQYQYLKRRHLLVEYRSEQYSIRDSFVDPVMNTQMLRRPAEYLVPEFDAEIPVFPFGLKNGNRAAEIFFHPFEEVHAEIYNDNDFKIISDYLWKEKPTSSLFFDFSNPAHVAELYLGFYDITFEEIEKEKHSALLETLKFYEEQTYLEPYQLEILHMKAKKYKNQEIAEYINKKYSKTYTANYISTIFRQKVIGRICDTAAYHIKLMENVFFEENFKKCNCCGKWYLIDSNNFVRKANSSDGFASKCKICDKKDRQRRTANKR